MCKDIILTATKFDVYNLSGQKHYVTSELQFSRLLIVSVNLS